MAVLAKLLEADFEGRSQIEQQLHDVEVRTIDENGSLELRVTSSQKAVTGSRVPSEGEVKDADGVIVHVLLHVVEGIATELEIYREDNLSVGAFPDASRMTVFSAG